MIVNRSDIINLVSKTNNLNISDIEYSIKKIIDYMSSNLYQGERIEIRGFGTISRKINKEKIVRNPKTNEKLFKNKSFKLHFKIGKILHRKINGLTDSHIEDEV